jgi:phosphatidate cytidylyltransferase
MHFKRLVIALILLPLLYIYVMYLPPKYFLFLMTFLSTIGLAEFYAMCRIKGLFFYSGLFWGAALLIVSFISPQLFLQVLLFAALTIMALRLFLKPDPAGSISAVAAAVFGLIYIPGLLTFQMNIIKTGPAWIVLLYTSVWAADSMAFYVGKSIGKRKLYPEISPNWRYYRRCVNKGDPPCSDLHIAYSDHRSGSRSYDHNRRSRRVDVQA